MGKTLHVVTFLFVAWSPEHNQWVLYAFSKVVPVGKSPRSTEVVTVGGVQFIYEGVPRYVERENAISYAFKPFSSSGEIPIFRRRATAPKLTEDDSEHVPGVRRALAEQGYFVGLTDLLGKPLA